MTIFRRTTALQGLLLLLANLTSPLAMATNPAEGSVSAENPQFVFEAGPHLVSNPAYPDTGACANPLLVCDDFALSVSVPSDLEANGQVARLTIHTVEASGLDDYDIYLIDGEGNQLNSSTQGGTPEEMVQFMDPGQSSFTIRVIPWLVTGTTTTTTITLDISDGGGQAGGGNAAPDGRVPFDPEAPRYHVYVSPPEEANDAGEPTVGWNPLTERAMFVSYTNALRVTFPEKLDEPLPEACDATWENKSGLITTLNSLDPIMYTDQVTGRTFNSQLSGANSLFEYSDDDGESWTPGQIGLPNGGADHQGVVSGPYPEGFPLAGLLYPNAVYYCSQSVATAFCARSDDGGQTFGPGYPFKNTDCAAGALHGHPKVAPDGTLYVPDSSQCVIATGLDGSSEKVVAFVSEDAGVTYDVRPIPQSVGGGADDPSVGIASDGTVYMCYQNADGTAHVAVSHDKGLTWENDQDIGAAAGLVSTRFPAMVAGDPDRAACAFLGTTTVGPDADLAFKGVWYPYVATTYDGGETWDLVNVSPNDYVQGHGGVGPSGTNRNLLDFNDLELDNFGRPMFAYADGCIGSCVADPAANSFAAKGTIARQVGGRTLYAEFDNLAGSRFSTALAAPAAACAVREKSQRTLNQTLVAWNAPDNGGSPISNYAVYRATSATGPFEFVGNAGPKTRFVDATADVNVAEYYYKIVAENSVGTAPDSNVINLPIEEVTPVDTCSLPGETIAVDAAGDSDAPLDDVDLISISVAEPPSFPDHFVITSKVAGFTAGEPLPTSFYPLLFPLVNDLYIAMDVSQGTPRFVYGSYVDVTNGALTFTEEGTLDERSTYDASGNIVYVVPKSLFGKATGEVLAGFDARSRVIYQSVPSQDTAGPADYLVRGSENCGKSATVLASLQGSTGEGPAPLTVAFTVTGQASEGAQLATFSLDFGDGEFIEDRPFNSQGIATVSHSYLNPGTYRAYLTVTDSQGRKSTNLAEHTVIAALEERGGLSALRGGALGWLLLVILLPLGWRRRG